MMRAANEPHTLLALSRLFAYPRELPRPEDLDRVLACEGFRRPALTRLQSRYVRLFINALPETPCPPLGSYYLEGVLMGASTTRIAALYREYGCTAEEPADHIAVELEFLAFLRMIQVGDAACRPLVQPDMAFLLAHLGEWTPAFFRQVEAHDRDGFYGALARAGRRIIGGIPCQ